MTALAHSLFAAVFERQLRVSTTREGVDLLLVAGGADFRADIVLRFRNGFCGRRCRLRLGLGCICSMEKAKPADTAHQPEKHHFTEGESHYQLQKSDLLPLARSVSMCKVATRVYPGR